MARIDVRLKMRCVEASQTMTMREVYENVFLPEHNSMNYETFRHHLRRWKRKCLADELTLSAGTYADFIAHNATVQVNGNGEVVQAWIKQTVDDHQFDELMEAIKEHTEPRTYETTECEPTPTMLEIGLYDMHFGLPNDYSNVFSELAEIINAKHYEEINVIIGQDLLHNDDFRGRTSKGTQIETVDLRKAWEEARDFWVSVIDECFKSSTNVNIKYVKGNHDESMCWAFVQMLKIMYPTATVDDSLKKRKCIYWRECFIGLTHGNETKSSLNDLRGQFTIKFPEEFAKSKVREIHSGHLHAEKEGDVYGVMVRRLSTANVEDKWSDDEGYVGAHKRFMVFEWTPGKLTRIYYLYK